MRSIIEVGRQDSWFLSLRTKQHLVGSYSCPTSRETELLKPSVIFLRPNRRPSSSRTMLPRWLFVSLVRHELWSRKTCIKRWHDVASEPSGSSLLQCSGSRFSVAIGPLPLRMSAHVPRRSGQIPRLYRPARSSRSLTTMREFCHVLLICSKKYRESVCHSISKTLSRL